MGNQWETGNKGYTRQRKTKQKHNTICVEQHYMQTNANNENKTWAFLQTTRGEDKPNSVFDMEIVTDGTTRKSERKDT